MLQDSEVKQKAKSNELTATTKIYCFDSLLALPATPGAAYAAGLTQELF